MHIPHSSRQEDKEMERNEMMEKYERLEIEVIEFEAEDIITQSENNEWGRI